MPENFWGIVQSKIPFYYLFSSSYSRVFFFYTFFIVKNNNNKTAFRRKTSFFRKRKKMDKPIRILHGIFHEPLTVLLQKMLRP